MIRRLVGCLVLSTLLALVVSGAYAAPATHSLSDYGDISTVAAATDTLTKALAALQLAGGGILEIPTEAPAGLKLVNLSQTDASGNAVTIMDYRKGMVTYHLPPIGQEQSGNWSGYRMERYLNFGQGASLPHCGMYSNQSIQNFMVSGASSYMLTLTEPVKKGKDAKLYVDTIRGIWVGAFLNVTGNAMGYAEPFDRIFVKSIGWDPAKKRNFFTADLKYDHPLGALVYNKHVVNGLQLDDWSQCDNQSMELQVSRSHYAVGDAFVISGSMKYMGNVFSGFGDEGGVVINAETIGEVDAFHSTVESVDWTKDTVVYAPGQTNAQTLSTSRPLVNYNPKKWITAGQVIIVPAGGTYKGNTYPNVIGGPSNVFNYQGGLIQGGADCPWDESVIGRYFAVTEDSETLLPNDPSSAGGYATLANRPIYRWYEINGFRRNPDGTKVIKILRVRWSAVAAGAPTLYDDANYTADGHERPLKYAIAPGAWVYDVSQGWQNVVSTGGFVDKNTPRQIRVTPNGDRGTAFDFAPGDLVEQAIGSDPWCPRPIRIRQFDQVPTTMDNSSIEVEQVGRVQVPNGIMLAGIINSREELSTRKDKKPPYGTMINLRSLCNEGIRFSSEVLGAAMFFTQPNDRKQPIWWRNSVNGSSQLSVDPRTGTFEFINGDMSLGNRSLVTTRGLSATEKPAANLRGINVSVPVGATEFEVKFATPEPDNNYALTVSPNWMTQFQVRAKRPDGFTVRFGQAATAADVAPSVDWILVR
ncbi:MAG TPA: hypothetical protein VGM19_02170 [Armatimonadota bacterium]